MTSRNKQFLRLGIYAVLLLLAVGYTLLCLTGRGLPCFFYEHFHLRCPSCGASTAFLALLRMDFGEAARQNPMFAYALYPIAGLIALQDIILCIANLLQKTDRISFLRFICGAKEEKS